MRRVFAVVACGLTLAACGSFSWPSMPSMPSMDFTNSRASAASAAVRVESEPPGAEARGPTGQSCRTPCSLAVASSGDFAVNLALNGYLPQTVGGHVFPAENFPSDTEFGSASAGVRVVPDPVFAVLERAPPTAPPPVVHKRRPSRPRTAAAKPQPAPTPDATTAAAPPPFPPPPAH
jgi:hypothetical protein